MLNGGGVELVTKFLVDRNASFAIITKNSDLDQTMMANSEFGFFNNSWCQTIVTNHDNWIEVVGIAFKGFALCGGDSKCGHGLDDRALE